jgi:secreted trypsin-like serine protease
MNSAAKKEKRKMEKAKLEELSAAQELERARRETKNKDSRVVGGFEVTDNSWQFMVDIGGLCGGSLISNQFVLTAAHCCTSSSFNFSVIRLGIKDLTDNANSINRSAKSYVVHPDFDPTKFKHDICLVLLDSPVQINDRVQPISLPMESEELFSQNSDSYLYVAGWGMTGERNTKPISELISHKLLNAMIPFVPDATCQQDDYYGTLVDTEYTFCAGYELDFQNITLLKQEFLFGHIF